MIERPLLCPRPLREWATRRFNDKKGAPRSGVVRTRLAKSLCLSQVEATGIRAIDLGKSFGVKQFVIAGIRSAPLKWRQCPITAIRYANFSRSRKQPCK
jgi:hypothetical protein